MLPAVRLRYAAPAMDLPNMRSLGVRSIVANCDCGRRPAYKPMVSIVARERRAPTSEVAAFFVFGPVPLCARKLLFRLIELVREIPKNARAAWLGESPMSPRKSLEDEK